MTPKTNPHAVKSQKPDLSSMDGRTKVIKTTSTALHSFSHYNLDKKFTVAARTAVCAVIDTETTGFGGTSRLLDIGIVLIDRDYRIMATLTQLVNPHTPSDPGAEAVNHITLDMLENQPTPDQVLPQILDAIRTLPLIGHNLSYDIDVINREAAIAGIQGLEPQQICDTMELSMEMFPESRHHALQDVLNRLHIPEPEQHRALADALQTWQAYEKLCAMDTPRAETEEEQQQARRVREAKTNDVMRARYTNGNDTTPVNDKPEGEPLQAQGGGENLSECLKHQDVLSRYPRGSWFWVTTVKGRIRSGKYKGYPTVFVYLDGEEIGFLGEPLMAKHWGQIPDMPTIALAHTVNNADESKPFKARIELPKAHQPINLEQYKKTE
ncbi:3'-5' exonuclease [Bifidobacterium sp. ESL0682]|uniref:3'-5' exonuclease n=1 Tax=Bifidobacterium sp. ESL0682 TaxID=2983212 RepID=UPI0023F6A078|nr:3'-5' exonuclease [Bifidobacterium sp. ESL0682]WEV42649.1 3'-5' exonuclease [Bifidobacterium sp. ESL0682]